MRVGLDADGSASSIVVDQMLALTGYGDFYFIVHGPARDATGDKDAPVRPGLRRGDIIWSGFSPGKRILHAIVHMDPVGVISRRLPVSVSVEATRDGAAATPPARAPLDVILRITDTAGDLLSLHDAIPDRAALGGLLDRLNASLRVGGAPTGGSPGIPLKLAVSSLMTPRPEELLLPVEVAGSVSIVAPGSTVMGVDGGELSAGAIRFADALTQAAPTREIRFHIESGSLDAVKLRFTVRPSFDESRTLTPPRGTTWGAWGATATPRELRDALMRAQRVMWRAAEFARYRAYLGNPTSGQSRTTFTFSTVTLAAPMPVARERLKPVALALAIAGALVLVGVATVVWRRS